MIGNYVKGPRPKLAHEALKKADRGATLSRSERTLTRNSLMLRLLLLNGRRSGDITHLPREQVLNAGVPKNLKAKVQLNVSAS